MRSGPLTLSVAPNIFVFLACISAVVSADDTGHRELIRSSTTPEKAKIHIVFTETLKSKEQSKWIDAYAGTVEVFAEEKSIGKFRASTLPNFLPGRGKPDDWKYAVVQATCAFPTDLRPRFYTWQRTIRADKQRPCLRLASEVPTVNLSSVRAAEMTRIELLELLEGESKNRRYMKYAEAILVHSGSGQSWRGSAGCLTLHPDDASKFFDLIPVGVNGTLELNRGIEDENTLTSRCY